MKERIEAYAVATKRSKSHVVMEAVAEYLAWRVPQIEDLQAAVRAADAGEFATDAEVAAVFDRYSEPSSPKARPAAKKSSRRGTR